MFIFGNQSDIYQLMKVFKFIPFILLTSCIKHKSVKAYYGVKYAGNTKQG